MKKVVFAFIFTLFLITGALAQTLTTSVNRNKIPLGETFVATVEYTGNGAVGQPDFSALNEDFETYGIATGFQSSSINGSVQNSYLWDITLLPKKAGRFVIPSFSIGGAQSNTVEIEAGKDMPKDTGTAKNEVTFSISGELEPGNQSPYVQQQINYVATLHDAGGLQGGEPQVIGDGNEWIVRNLKQPEIETKVVGGKNVRNVKFYYAFFPQKSGKLRLPTIQFDGYYADGQAAMPHPLEQVLGGRIMLTGFEDAFARRIPVQLQTKPETIDVQPAVSKNWWIPAEKVELFSEWEKKTDLKAGDTINRAIYIRVTGVLESQLPDLTFKPGAGFKQYPEKSESQAMIKDDKIVATKKLNNVYVLSQSGDVVFPEISLDWFNVKTRQMEKAVLPASTISVAKSESPNLGMPQPKANEAAAPASAPMPVSVPAALPVSAPAPASVPAPKQDESSMLLLYIALAFIFGVALSYFLFGAKKLSLKKAVIDAAKKNDFRALQENLVRWAGGSNFQDVIRATKNEEFEAELDRLSKFLYSREKREDWNADAFIKAFKKASKKKLGAKTGSDPLPPLY